MNIFFFFFNDTATTEIYTLSLHDALPISRRWRRRSSTSARGATPFSTPARSTTTPPPWRAAPRASSRRSRRSEEHTSELQSRQYLVCRLLLEKKKKIKLTQNITDTNNKW